MDGLMGSCFDENCGFLIIWVKWSGKIHCVDIIDIYLNV